MSTTSKNLEKTNVPDEFSLIEQTNCNINQRDKLNQMEKILVLNHVSHLMDCECFK